MNKFKNFFIYFFLFLFGVTFIRHFLELPILSILYIGLVIFISYKIKIPKFGLFLFIGALIIRLIAVFLIDTPIQYDYYAQYSIAKQILNGNLHAASGSAYMLRWGYQMGYTLFMVPLISLAKGPILIKLVNCVFSSLIAVFIYLITKEISNNQRVAQIIGAAYMCFPFHILFNTVLSNQHISAFLLLFSVYILISKKPENMNNILKFILVGLCLAFSDIFRPGAIIFITAIILFLLITSDKGKYKIALLHILVLLVTYFSISTIASTIAIKTGVSPSGFHNKLPLWEFAVGFNPETKGDYNVKLAEDFLAANDATRRQIVYDYTVGSLPKLPSLFLYKAQHFWLDVYLDNSIGFLNNSYITVFGREVSFNLISTLLYSMTSLYLYLFFGLMLLAVYINRKKMPKAQFLLLMVLLVYFGVYLLIECKPRYAFTAQIFMFIMSAYSLPYVIDKIKLLEKLHINSKKKQKKRH